MKLKKSLTQGLIIGGLFLAATFVSHPARANVYATNIKLDGGATNVLAAIGDSVTITYILNEPASRGVIVKILSGGSVVRSLSLAAYGPGAQQGLNSVVWDGRDANSNNVAPGAYSVSITAASSGYTNWTQTTVDSDTTYIWVGHGLAVDQNTNSVYYGRIFVGNSEAGPNFNPGDVVGILKMNADGSPADEGILSTNQSGHTWTDNDLSPWKLTVSADDYVYVDDLANGGEVYRWDPTFSSNALVYVLQTNNQPSGVHLSGPAVAGTGTNTQIWMADSTNNSAYGVLKWVVTTNGMCAANDKGVSVVGLGTNQNFSAVALDKYGNIYTCQSIAGSGDANPRVFMYPAYDPSTNGNIPQTNAVWAVGATDDTYGGASGLAVDPTGTYLAVAFQGIGIGLPSNGNTKILYATNGALVTNLDLNVPMDGQPDLEHQDTDCAWDDVGNVYYIDNWYGYWRAFSPPGTNQSTTVAVMQVLVQSAPAPVITSVSVATNTVTLLFTGSASDTVTNFVVLSSAVVNGSYSPVPGATISQVGPGKFRAAFPVDGPDRFYRIERGVQSAPEPVITSVSVATNTVTLLFTGSASDTVTSFVVLSSAVVNGSYSPVAGVNISQVGPGMFRATFPLNGPNRFYRIQRVVPSAPAPVITSLLVATNTVTLLFTGSASDTVANFVVLSSAVVTGGYSPVAGVNISQVGPGMFRAACPVNGPTRFYRIQR